MFTTNSVYIQKISRQKCFEMFQGFIHIYMWRDAGEWDVKAGKYFINDEVCTFEVLTQFQRNADFYIGY